MNTLLKTKSAINNYNLIVRGDKIVIGVSGGPDSMALLFMLNSLKSELGLSLYVAHLNHKLRKDASRDMRFVEKISRDLNLPFFSDEADIKKLAKKGSLEEIARQERLKFLFKAAKKFKANKIALGHTKDDQAETVLMRILRGTGLYGLRAIVPRRRINGFTIIRPLIEIERAEIYKFLKKIKIKPRIDSTNFQDIYFRNKIRNQLLPALKKNYNRNIKDILSFLAENAGLDYDYLYAVSLSAFERIKVKATGVKIVLELGGFLKLHPAIQRMVMRIAFQKLSGSLRRLNFRHWKELEDLLSNRPATSIVDLPAKTMVQKEKGRIVISLRNT